MVVSSILTEHTARVTHKNTRQLLTRIKALRELQPVHGELPIGSIRWIWCADTTAGMHDFSYEKIFHRETANSSRTSVTFLFLANASRLLHFRILLDSEKLRVFGLYAEVDFGQVNFRVAQVYRPMLLVESTPAKAAHPLSFRSKLPYLRSSATR